MPEIPAEDLKLCAGYQHRVVRVGSHTLENLKAAAAVIQATKVVLPYGTENQPVDVVRTCGESSARAYWTQTESIAANLKPHTDPFACARSAIEWQAGNCDEHAAVAFSLLQAKSAELDAPVRLVDLALGQDSTRRHYAAMIGDERDSRWGSEAVLVDPSAQYAVAHTLSEMRPDMQLGQVMLETAPGHTPPEEQDKLANVPTVATWQVDEQQRTHGFQPVGPQLLEEAYGMKMDEATKSGTGLPFFHPCSAIDPSTSYTDRHRWTYYSSLPADVLERNKAGQKALEAFVQNHPFWREED